MIADITLDDADQARTYHLTVDCRVRPEIGAAPGYCVDVYQVYVEEVVVYFDKQGSEVRFQNDERQFATRFVERKYQKEIEVLCIEAFERAQAAA